MKRVLAAVSAGLLVAAGCAVEREETAREVEQAERDVWKVWEASDLSTDRPRAKTYEEQQGAYYDLLRTIEPTVKRRDGFPRDHRFVPKLEQVHRNILNSE